MKTVFLAGLLLLSTAFARGATPRANAERAQALLGPGVWSRLLKIENTNRRGTYPPTVYATVFEMAGVLWFYTDTDGTQSLSLHRDNLVSEKADMVPLLKAICPSFDAFEVLNLGARHSVAPNGLLENGCFIESVAALRVRTELGLPTGRPELLAYYLPQRLGGRGHTVLTYEAGSQLYVLDPEGSGVPIGLPLSLETDGRGIVAKICPKVVDKVRMLPVRDFTFSGGKWAFY